MKHRVKIPLNLIVYNAVLMFLLRFVSRFLESWPCLQSIILRRDCFYIVTPSRVVLLWRSFFSNEMNTLSENSSIQHVFKLCYLDTEPSRYKVSLLFYPFSLFFIF